MKVLVRLFVIPLMLALASTPAFGQATASSSLSGLAVDSDGGVIPGATVVVKNNATNVTQTVVTNSAGKFAIPSLDPGTYTVTVSLTGFKTYVADNVRLLAGRPGDITAKLEVGNLTETVSVKAGSELIQTQSATVTSTLSVEQLKDIPLVSRNALYAVNLLPGVATTGGPRAALINGLPNNTVNITIDGVGTGNMLQSTDGFFSMVTPRMDAVEEITVTGAVPGAGSGSGSVQVQFVTKSGTNQFNSSVYHYARRPSFNTQLLLQRSEQPATQPGHRRPVRRQHGRTDRAPGLFDGRGKAFFFFNFEHLRQPSSATRTRTIIGDNALKGIFTWDLTGGGTATKDLMALAAATGNTATFDPTILALMNQMRSAAGTTGTINTTTARNTLQYVVSGGIGRQPVLADRPRGHQPDAEAPADGHVLLAAVQQQARPAEQRRVLVPRVPERSVPGVVPDHRVRGSALHASAAASSTRRAAAGSGRRTTSSATSIATCSRIRTSTASACRS